MKSILVFHCCCVNLKMYGFKQNKFEGKKEKGKGRERELESQRKGRERGKKDGRKETHRQKNKHKFIISNAIGQMSKDVSQWAKTKTSRGLADSGGSGGKSRVLSTRETVHAPRLTALSLGLGRKSCLWWVPGDQAQPPGPENQAEKRLVEAGKELYSPHDQAGMDSVLVTCDLSSEVLVAITELCREKDESQQSGSSWCGCGLGMIASGRCRALLASGSRCSLGNGSGSLS